MKEIYYEPCGYSFGVEVRCFACDEEGHVSSRAVTNSQRDSERIRKMFENAGLYTELVHNTDWQDVQLGACESHFEKLRRLQEVHKETKRINLASIVRSLI